METLGMEVAETARIMRRDFERRAAGAGVTPTQWRVLARLAREDGLRQVDLAEALDVEPITLCRMVDRLEEANLVERRRDERDRRAWNIFLSESARPVIEELHALATDFYAEALAGISEADKAMVKAVLARIRRNLDSDQSKGAGAARSR